MDRLLQRGRPHLVALDHGLSMGWTETQDPPIAIARACCDAGLNGAVVHAGLIPRVAFVPDFVTFLQLHGNPPGSACKTVVASPRQALESDCIGVAVEYRSSGASSDLRETAKVVAEARSRGLLVLVMANYSGSEPADAAKAVVGATQLGADLVKLRLPRLIENSGDARLREVVADAPPVVVAGDDASTDLENTLQGAAGLGFTGSCIGRHYFDASRRARSVETVLAFMPRDPS